MAQGDSELNLQVHIRKPRSLVGLLPDVIEIEFFGVLLEVEEYAIVGQRFWPLDGHSLQVRDFLSLSEVRAGVLVDLRVVGKGSVRLRLKHGGLIALDLQVQALQLGLDHIHPVYNVGVLLAQSGLESLLVISIVVVPSLRETLLKLGAGQILHSQLGLVLKFGLRLRLDLGQRLGGDDLVRSVVLLVVGEGRPLCFWSFL